MHVKLHILAFFRWPLVAMVTGAGPKSALLEGYYTQWLVKFGPDLTIFGGNYSILKFALGTIK